MSKEQSEMLKQKSALMQLWINLKNSIFDVLFVVLDKVNSEGGQVTLMSIVYESGIDYIQMMQFPFNFTIIMVWNGGETLNNIFNFLTNVLQINNLMPSLNFNAFLICLYLLILLIILVILDIVYVSYSFTKKKFSFTLPLVLLAQIVPLFVTFLFIPIMEFLTNIINCNPSVSDPSVQVMQYFPSVVCFQGMHLVHSSVTLFFTSIFVFISTIVAMTLFEPRMTSSSILARKSSRGEVIFIINKVVCQFFFAFTPFDQTWIYIALMFFPALWLFCFYQFSNPFYNKKVGKLYRIFSSYFFWTVLMLSFSQVLLLLGFNFEGAMVIWFCGLPFIGFNIAYESRSNIDNLFSSNMKFKTGEELEAHLMYVLLLLNQRKKDENSNMLLVGYIEKHIETCVEEDCPIKIKKPKKEEILSEMDENCKLLIVQLERMYKQGIKKFPNCTKLHISFAFFYMEQLRLNAKAYEEFMKAEQAAPSFIEEFIIYRFKKIIKEKLEESQEEENDLIEIIRFDNHVSLCEEAMLLSAKLHKEFWSELVEETPSLQKLNDTGSRIISVVNSVRSNYAQVSKINSHSPEITHNFGLYSMFISQNIAAGKKALAQAKRAYFEKKAKGEMLPSKATADMEGQHSLVVSAGQSSMGKILAVGDGFIEMAGYLKEQITEKSIDKLLPQIMTFYHQFAMNQWLADTSRTYMSNERNGYFREVHSGFIKQKNGFIIPVRYKVIYSVFEEKFYVHISNEKEFSQNLEFRMYIITDNRGVIREISSLGFAYFQFSKENLSSNERYIDELGINLSDEIYSDEGILVSIPKQRQKDQPVIEQDDAVVEGEDDEFFVRGEKVWMPAEAAEEEEEGERQLKDGKVEIGSIFCLERLSRDKSQPKDVKLDSLNHFAGDILNFYEMNEEEEQEEGEDDEGAPLYDSRASRTSKLKLAVNQLIEADRQALKEKSFLRYGGKIKTYRLVRGQLKRVVEEWGEEGSEYDELGEENLQLSLFQAQKLRNPVFVQKIKNAINTNIDHSEVTRLKILFSLFLVALGVLSVTAFVEVNAQLNSLTAHAETNMAWVSDQFYINNLIHLALNASQEANLTQAYLDGSTAAQDYTISFDPPLKVNMTNYNGEVSEVSLMEALTWMQGYVLNYFNEQSLTFSDTTLLFFNFYNNIYPAVEAFTLPLLPFYTSTLAITALLLLLSLLAVCGWIYYIMMIDRKCSDIILWFLDIPIPYVTYLQANCNTFLKTHTPVKELVDRGINFHDKNLYLEEFNSNEQEDEYNQENKSRKIMIARYKKKTLLSRCNCYYLSTLWLLIYASLLSAALLVVLEQEVNFFRFINAQWQMTARQLIWSSTIPNNLRLTQQLGMQRVGNVDLLQFQTTLEQHFLNPVSQKGLASVYEELVAYGTEIASLYVLYFEDDICELVRYDEEQANICKSFLNSKLEGGIQSVFQYYATLERDRYIEIQHAQYDFINILLFELFSLWKQVTETRLASAGSIITLLLVLYLVVSVLGFLLLWLLYLRKLNVRLNQTIQMLNMIPIRMLPKSRRDIRDFFAWIIRQANRTNAHP